MAAVARRWSRGLSSDTFTRKIIVLLVFGSSVAKAAPDAVPTAALCPAYISFAQLPSDFDEENARGIKRSIYGDISGESAAFSISPNHEIQPTDRQWNPPLPAQTSAEATANKSENTAKKESGATNAISNLLKTGMSSMNNVSAHSPRKNVSISASTTNQIASEKRPYLNVPISENQEVAAPYSGTIEKREHRPKHKEEHRDENSDKHNMENKNQPQETGKAEKRLHDEELNTSKNKDEKADKMKHYTGHHRFGKKKQGDTGRNAGKYLEGHHKKGHRTKGGHKIHKKNEYHKKLEFYHEHHDDGDGLATNRGFNRTRKKSSGRKHKEGSQNAMHKKAHKSIRGGHKKANKHKHITVHVDEKGHSATHGHKKRDAKNGSIKEGEKYT